MKKNINIVILVLLFSVLMASCNMTALSSIFKSQPITEEYEIVYGDTLTITDERLAKYDDLIWESTDASIASVEEQTISGNTPGEAVITVSSSNKAVAEYHISVVTVPITGIVLSTNNCEITVDDTFQLHYSLFPDDASDYGLVWKSADDSVATVDENGMITGKLPGQTTITISTAEGIIASCATTVNQKKAYDLLSNKERQFVDCFLEHIDSFKNPASVVIREIGGDVSDWTVKVSAQNGFGGTTTTVYYLSPSLGFWNWDTLLDVDLDITITPDHTYDIRLINDAIADRR